MFTVIHLHRAKLKLLIAKITVVISNSFARRLQSFENRSIYQQTMFIITAKGTPQPSQIIAVIKYP